MDYLALKHIHMGLAVLSVSGFIIRWVWRMRSLPVATKPLTRIVPHIVDTLFLGSAIWMIALLGRIPVSDAWLVAKLGGLLAYIILGMIAMRSAPAGCLAIPAFFAAVTVFGWVVSIAISKSPLGFLA